MMSIPDFVKYQKEVLGPQMKPEVFSEIMTLETKGELTNPRYMELIMNDFIPEFFIRMPMENWPDPVSRGMVIHVYMDISLQMMGAAQFTKIGELGKWDRTADVSKIAVPTLFIGGKYDMMDPDHIKIMATKVNNAEYLLCPEGSHTCLYDDQEFYFNGLIEFINKVNNQN